MKNNSADRKTSKYKKAIKLNSQPGIGVFSLSHAPAMVIPLLCCAFLLILGMPMIRAIVITLWIFTAFLFVIRDKPERFVRRIFGSRKKHWTRKLSRSQSLFNKN